MSIEHPQKMNAYCCCKAPVPATPEEISNRPRLSAIRYRSGTYASFRQAMIEAIAEQPELHGWTARRDDYGIALLEMWAYVADILTFYQERIANEAFVRTALLRESVLRLAALLDYKPAPGVAATANLAFALEKDATVHVPRKLRVQSVPGQDEKPQKFETVEAITAYPRLNRIRVFPKPEPDNPLVAGSAGGTLHPDKADEVARELAARDNLVIYQHKPLTAAGAPSVHAEDKKVKHVRTVDWRKVLEWEPEIRSSFSNKAKVCKWVRKFRVFGYNAPSTFLAPTTNKAGEVKWKKAAYDHVHNKGSTLKLDAVYDDLKENTGLLVVSTRDGYVSRVTVTAVQQVEAVVKGPLSGGDESKVPIVQSTVTQVSVKPEVNDLNDQVTVVYELEGDEVKLWGQKYGDAIAETETEVYAHKSELGTDASEAEKSISRGRRVVLEDKAGMALVAAVTDCTDGEDHLKITFTPGLTRSLDAETAVLYRNVAKAAHGERVADEALGNGDASIGFQSFAIKKSPVTFVPKPGAPHGAENTLEVRVGGVLWHEVNTLYGRASDERVFTTKVDDGGVMTVHFGNGVTGARLPTGRDNVVATYRQGIGREGNVKANSLSTLLDRPVGLKSVTNPGPARGGADAESRDKARANAPNTVRTFGRIVSLRDFEDAAREFAGVAKARATCAWDGEEQVVHLTVAGDNGDPITGDPYKNLVKDLNSRRDQNRKLVVESYDAVPVQIEAVIRVHTDYVPEDVRVVADAALQNFFAFHNLDLGQPIHLSDVYRVLQDVKGVVAVDVNLLQFKNPSDRDSHGATDQPVQRHLRIFPTELAFIKEAVTDAIVNIGMSRNIHTYG